VSCTRTQRCPIPFHDDHFIQYTLEITGRDRKIDDEIKRLFLKKENIAPFRDTGSENLADFFDRKQDARPSLPNEGQLKRLQVRFPIRISPIPCDEWHWAPTAQKGSGHDGYALLLQA
jgi:hypothetical protein